MASFGGFGAPPAAGEEGKSPFAGFTLAPPTAAAGEEGKPPAPFGGGFAAPAAPASFGAPAAGAESAGAATAEGEGDGDGEGVPAPEEESTAEFTPLVHLDEVEVKTHEEEESVDFKMRAKLYRFTETLLNKGSGKKEWIERGIGEVKLLKHKESQKIRMLMRQEKTMKVIVNHVCDPRISLQPNCGSDRSWVWSAFDFSEGDLVEEVFAIKFGSAENAQKFKEAFEEAQKEMARILAGEDSAEGAEEADEAAAAIASLSTGEPTAEAGAEPAAEAPADEAAPES